MRLFPFLLLLLAGCTLDTPIDRNDTSPRNGTQQAEFVAVEYQPVQCQVTPWEDWYADGNAQFPAEPTTMDLVAAYYGDRGLEVRNVERIEHDAVCLACDTCPQAYYVTMEIRPSDRDMLEDGWEGA